MADEEKQMTEEEMMAAFEAAESAEQAAASAAASAAPMDEGTLSQDEIDSLLGFSSGTEKASTGIQAVLDRSQENYERLPMLEVVFDRFVRTLSTSLRNFTGENVDANIEAITSMRFEDYLNSVPLPAMMAIFQAVEWENLGLITLDSSLTYSMVDVLLGGGRTNRPVRIEGRPFTTIEQDIVKSLCKLILEDMSGAFNPLTPATFRMDRLESNPRFATITRPQNPVILISMRVDMDERGGKADIVLPYITLEPIKDLLIQMFSGESFGTDISWENHLSLEVLNSQMTIRAHLDEKSLTLRDLGSLQVGDTLVMDTKFNDEIHIRCKNIDMFKGHLGAADKNLAIQVSHVFTKGIRKLL